MHTRLFHSNNATDEFLDMDWIGSATEICMLLMPNSRQSRHY
jgi:hypothetical protein